MYSCIILVHALALHSMIQLYMHLALSRLVCVLYGAIQRYSDTAIQHDTLYNRYIPQYPTIRGAPESAQRASKCEAPAQLPSRSAVQPIEDHPASFPKKQFVSRPRAKSAATRGCGTLRSHRTSAHRRDHEHLRPRASGGGDGGEHHSKTGEHHLILSYLILSYFILSC